MPVTEINLIVSDLERSHAFYLAVGCSMRSVTDPEGETPRAWMTTEGPMPVSLHTEEFASWWDETGPRAAPGSTTIDITLDEPELADAILEVVQRSGGRVIAPARNMPWGQCYAIFADPDGYRWGIKTRPQ